MLMANEVPIEGRQRDAYGDVFTALTDAGVEFLVGGAFALYLYLKRWRATKDLDVFLRPRDVGRALLALEAAGFSVELTNASWIAKARRPGVLVDLIFSSYNGLFPVDDAWMRNARPGMLLGEQVRIVGPEEMVVSKSFVAARDRFDGSDISWLLRALGRELDWERIEEMMGAHWQILLWQLVHFLYVFPAHKAQVPRALVERLLRRMIGELGAEAPPNLLCRGPMLDAVRYLADLGDGGAPDAGLYGEPVCDG